MIASTHVSNGGVMLKIDREIVELPFYWKLSKVIVRTRIKSMLPIIK